MPNPKKEEHSVRSQVKRFLKGEFRKGKMHVQHLLGLGHQPNAIPPGVADIAGPQRTVLLGWHPVAGFAGKWFAEQTGLGKLITAKTQALPDPTQHWGVLVGEYAHQLWMDEHLNVIYTNERVDPAVWQHTYAVGHTRFSDEALRQAAEMTIHAMRARRAAYHLITNNCQSFALRMLEAIQVGMHREFATTYEVYRAAVGRKGGAVADLFRAQADALPAPGEDEAERERPPEQVVRDAQRVMDANTTKLDKHFKIF